MVDEVTSWKEVQVAGWGSAWLERDRCFIDLRRFGGRMMMKGREEEEFLCEVAESTKEIKCKGSSKM
jgi:hypothetical protein